MDKFLTQEELLEMLGTPSKKRQIELLVENGIPYIERYDGRAAVLWGTVRQVLKAVPEPQQVRPDGFNWEALKEISRNPNKTK